jgi:hypothetical protein
VGIVGLLGIEPVAPNAYPSPSFTAGLLGAFGEQGHDGKVHTLFQDCEVWGKKAEAAGELEAGQLALFEGKLARRKKGESWETLVAGFEVTPGVPPVAAMTGSSN